MKKLSYLLLFIFLASCTSNTIFKKPEDLIPSDTMSLLMQDMMVASSAKFVKNLNIPSPKFSKEPIRMSVQTKEGQRCMRLHTKDGLRWFSSFWTMV